jgi:putative hydrolase of HD superfamily
VENSANMKRGYLDKNEQIKKADRIHKEIDKLKYIFRQSALISDGRKENSAEHSWHVGCNGYASSPNTWSMDNVDLLKVIKMIYDP